MVKSETSSGALEEELSRRKKRRNVGAFPCSKCSKVFSRSDHLARHYLNHQPKQVYVCDFFVKEHNGAKRTCGKTFVRRDLRERHLRRHLSEISEDHLGADRNGKRDDSVASPLDISNLIELKCEVTAGATAPPETEQKGTSATSLGISVASNLIETNTHHATRSLREKNPDQTMIRRESPVHKNSKSYHTDTSTGLHSGSDLQMPLKLQGKNPPQARPQHIVLQKPFVTQPYQSQMQNNTQGVVFPDQNFIPPHQQYGNFLSAQSAHTTQQHNGMHMRPQTHIHMGPPSGRQDLDLFKTGEMGLNGQSFVQSQNDILSWLFMESPNDLNFNPATSTSSSAHSGLSESPQSRLIDNVPQQQVFHQSENTLQPAAIDSSPTWSPLVNPTGAQAADSMLNVGLYDLNYFSRSDNPLDDVFLRLHNGHMGNSHGDKILLNVNTISTTSSSSPTTTNDSVTPQYFSDIHVNGIDRGTVQDRLQFHSVKLNIEKNKHFYMSERLWIRIMSTLPELTAERLKSIFVEENDMLMMEHRVSFYLYGYWEAFHRRFSILHKPSFNTATAEPLLLLSMLMIGSMYCATSPADSAERRTCPEYKFCMLVAEPLRFKLFQHPGFKCPVAVWVLQTLNLLEWCEKNYLSRDMHERGHVHHGTTVQLLRRSPFLGGNPTIKNKPNNEASASGSEDDNSDGLTSDSEDQLNDDQSMFRKWVESESMKRITFMTFYLDTVDYIKFRHNPQIPFFQLQLLNLPCDEDNLWESNDINDSFKKLVKRQKKLQSSAVSGVRGVKDFNRVKPNMNFLTALKKLMKPQNTTQKYSFFTRSILFGGIVSIMHQMQQTELQNNFTVLSAGLDKGRSSHWKEVIVRALDAYEADLHSAISHMSSDPFFKTEDHQCKFPMYHLVSIIGISDINHYDIAIFGGSRRNMSVDVSSKDISIVKRKLKTIWNANGAMNSFNDLVNVRAVIQCYWLLWSLMLSPLNDEGGVHESQSFYAWDADHDCFDIMYAASIATLVLWCYTYSTCGLESSQFKDLEDSYTLEDQKCYEKLSRLIKEDGYNYLFRIRDEFSIAFQKQGLGSDYCLHKMGTNRRRVPLFDSLQNHCKSLPHISFKQNISGLCFLVGSKLYKSQWEIVRENAKLIINCGLRSIGKSTWQCPDLFENDCKD